MLRGLQFERPVLMGALVGVALFSLSNVAQAYVGPGLGLSAIGTIFAFIGALFLAVVGFVWYPIKRLFRRRTQSQTRRGAVHQTVSNEPADKPDAGAAPKKSSR